MLHARETSAIAYLFVGLAKILMNRPLDLRPFGRAIEGSGPPVSQESELELFGDPDALDVLAHVQSHGVKAARDDHECDGCRHAERREESQRRSEECA